MKAIILDYTTYSVCVETIPDKEKDRVEDYLYELGYHVDDCNWMAVKDDEPVPIFIGDKEEAVYVL
jgi:hypothetical protein